jgi:hypothetical protein
MSMTRYDSWRRRAGGRGISAGEVALTICVILGLLFVTARIMTIGAPGPAIETNAAGPDIATVNPAQDTKVAETR